MKFIGHLLLLFCALALSGSRAQAAVYVVTNTGDNGGVNPAPFAGTGTLRQAIVDANFNAGTDTITFNIPGAGAHTIPLATNLPPVNDPAVVDATTQPGFNGKPIIELDGSPGATGALLLTGGNSTVRGFVINRFTATTGPTAGIVTLGSGGNVIEGNYIGTNLAGDAVFGPGNQISYGIIVRNDRNRIEGNVLSDNSAGILLQNVAPSDNSSNNLIRGNFLGTDWTGTVDLGNIRMGVFFIGAGDGNRIERNVISGNDETGVFIDSDDNVVVGNYIGVAADGNTPLGNGSGVFIRLGGSNNTIGGTAPGAGNVIAYSTLSHGVFISDDGQPSAGNTVRGNSIYANALLGIDLAPGSPAVGGVTPNDAGDGDSGPNNLQNFPVVQTALGLPGVLVMVVSLNSQPNTQYKLDFYASASADPSGYGEGQRYLGSKVVTTNAAGNAVALSITLHCSFHKGEVLTATATDPAGNTSEFSAAVPIQ
jgi:trimeric autotransporter adhesin